MTSPYLDRPRRNILQALEDRGMSPDDIGWRHDAGDSPSPEKIRIRPSRFHEWGVNIMACLLILASGVAVTYNLMNRQAEIAETTPQGKQDSPLEADLEEIMPAAGPDSSPATPAVDAPLPEFDDAPLFDPDLPPEE